MQKHYGRASPSRFFGVSLLLPWLPMSGPYFVHVCILMLDIHHCHEQSSDDLRVRTVDDRTCDIHGHRRLHVGHTRAMRLGWSPWLTIPLGALGAAFVAVVSGYFFSRTRGFYYSMVTLFFGVAVEALIRSWASLTGGRAGFCCSSGNGRLHPSRVSAQSTLQPPRSHTTTFFLRSLITLLVLYRLERSDRHKLDGHRAISPCRFEHRHK